MTFDLGETYHGQSKFAQAQELGEDTAQYMLHDQHLQDLSAQCQESNDLSAQSQEPTDTLCLSKKSKVATEKWGQKPCELLLS